MSTKDDNLEEYLAEIHVKRTHEINYGPFADKDRLCMELLEPISFADDIRGRPVLLTYLRESTLPILRIYCTFLDKCFWSKLLYNFCDLLLYTLFYADILVFNDEEVIPVISLLRSERILIFFYSICQLSSDFCLELCRIGGINHLQTFLMVYHKYYSHGNICEVY